MMPTLNETLGLELCDGWYKMIERLKHAHDKSIAPQIREIRTRYETYSHMYPDNREVWSMLCVEEILLIKMEQELITVQWQERRDSLLFLQKKHARSVVNAFRDYLCFQNCDGTMSCCQFVDIIESNHYGDIREKGFGYLVLGTTLEDIWDKLELAIDSMDEPLLHSWTMRASKKLMATMECTGLPASPKL